MPTYSSPRSVASSSAALSTLYDAWLSCGAETLDPAADGSDETAPRTAVGERCHVDADGQQQRRGDALALLEQGIEQMQRLDVRVAVGASEPHSGADGVTALVVNWMSIALALVVPRAGCAAPVRQTTSAVD